jgi:hypothetical protein
VDNPANNVEWVLLEMLNQLKVLQKAIDEFYRLARKERWVQESDIPKLNYVKACARKGYHLHLVVPFNLLHASLQDLDCCWLFYSRRKPCPFKPIWAWPQHMYANNTLEKEAMMEGLKLRKWNMLNHFKNYSLIFMQLLC